MHYDPCPGPWFPRLAGEGVTWLLSGPLPGPICPHTLAPSDQPEPGPRTAGGVPLLPEPRLASCLGPCLPGEQGIPDSLQEPALGRGEGSLLLLPKILAHLPGVVGGDGS